MNSYKVEQLKIDDDPNGVKAAKLFKYAVSHSIKSDPRYNLIDRPLEEYVGRDLFVINDYSCSDTGLIIAGGAVLDGGFIASVFKDNSYACTKNYKDVLSSLVAAMIEHGGDRLVCRGSLAERYRAFGFIPVAHAAPGLIDDNYLPDKFYFYKPKENETLPSKPKKFENYDEAFQYLKAFMKKKKTLAATNRSHFLDDIYIG